MSDELEELLAAMPEEWKRGLTTVTRRELAMATLRLREALGPNHHIPDAQVEAFA